MVNTTLTYWEADGQSLQTYARNIATLEGRLSPPPLRGDDIIIPHQPGEKWAPKVVGSRILSLSMWVRDTDADGIRPTDSLSRSKLFNQNWRTLRNLLWTPGRQFELKKRFYVGDVIRTAVAKAEFRGGLEPTMIGRFGAKFSIDLKLADPYFYDTADTVVSLEDGDQTITLLGDADTFNISLEIDGARAGITVRNKTAGVEVQYNAALLSGDTTEIDIKNYRSWTVDAENPLGYVSSANIIHSGLPQWLMLKPGANVINLSSDSGTGSVTMKYREAWV